MASEHWANGHRWPCPLFYSGNHRFSGSLEDCTCGGDLTDASVSVCRRLSGDGVDVPASHVQVLLAALESARMENAGLTGAIEGLADRWDADLQREFGVGEDYTDRHARELRALLIGTPAPEATDV